MNKSYKCLIKQTETWGDFKIAPILSEDKFKIMKWRNDQIDILRQNKMLTEIEQSEYFKNVVEKLFEQDKPNQIIFGFYEKNILVGYGGLVHINWLDKNAEISFLTELKRAEIPQLFKSDWSVYLKLIEKIAFSQLNMKKIYTYAYDIRPMLNETLNSSEYILEARLKAHAYIKNKFVDVLINSKFNNEIEI